MDATFRTIVVIGIWGAGKSTVGRSLAKQIGWSYVDSDELIEDFVGAVRRRDQAALDLRARRLREVISGDIGRVVVSTNLRPLTGLNGELEPTFLSTVRDGRCGVIEVRRDLHEIASYLAYHAEALARRPSLRGTSERDLFRELQTLSSQLAPLYESVRLGVVQVAGQEVREAVRQSISLLEGALDG